MTATIVNGKCLFMLRMALDFFFIGFSFGAGQLTSADNADTVAASCMSHNQKPKLQPVTMILDFGKFPDSSL